MISITQLTNEALQLITETNTLPEGVNLSGISEKLTKHRFTPRLIASALLKERLHSDAKSQRTKRIELREEELDIRRERVQGLKEIIERLDLIEAQNKLILKAVTDLASVK